MIRKLAALLALMLVFVACGGDDDTTATTAADGEPATTAPAPASGGDDNGDGNGDGNGAAAPGAGDDFCTMFEPVVETQVGAFDLSPETLEESLNMALAAADDVLDAAPNEIEDDVQVLINGFQDLAAAMEDVDYNPFANMEAFLADPRVQNLDSAEYAAANMAINEYCGIEPEPGVDGGFGLPPDTMPPGATLPPDLVSGDLPENFNPDFVPPGVTDIQTIDVGIGYQVTFTSSAPWEEVLAHYTNVLGDPFTLQEAAGISAAHWFMNDGTTVVASDTAGTLTVTVAGPS